MTNAFHGKRALIAFSQADSQHQVEGAAQAVGLSITGYASNARDVFSFLMQTECDFVFADILLPMLPVEGLYPRICALPIYKRPSVLYFASENAGKIMKNAYSPLITLPLSAEGLEAKMHEIHPVSIREEDMRKAEEILSRMGFSDHPARKYLACASALTVNDRNLARCLKRGVYPRLSKVFGKTESAIADAVRRLIDKTYLSGDIENQYRLFGNTIDETRGKPTVSQLIALVSEIIRTEKT